MSAVSLSQTASLREVGLAIGLVLTLSYLVFQWMWKPWLEDSRKTEEQIQLLAGEVNDLEASVKDLEVKRTNLSRSSLGNSAHPDSKVSILKKSLAADFDDPASALAFIQEKARKHGIRISQLAMKPAENNSHWTRHEIMIQTQGAYNGLLNWIHDLDKVSALVTLDSWKIMKDDMVRQQTNLEGLISFYEISTPQ